MNDFKIIHWEKKRSSGNTSACQTKLWLKTSGNQFATPSYTLSKGGLISMAPKKNVDTKNKVNSFARHYIYIIIRENENILHLVDTEKPSTGTSESLTQT